MSDTRARRPVAKGGPSPRSAALSCRTPLPSSRPKPAEDDPAAPELVHRITESKCYLQADEDVAFLNQPETRGVRLQLDYFKAEDLLCAHAVKHTIVVFGSTRIPEPSAARRRLDLARSAAAEAPADAGRRRAVAIAQRIVAKSRYYEVARDFGRLVGSSVSTALEGRVIVMTGGGPGIMEAANRGAHDAGANTAGLNITLPHEQYPNPYVTPDLCFRFHYFAIRKLHFLLRARALVAFPGGYGTMDELFETLTLVQTRKMAPLPIVLVGRSFWRRAVHFDFLVDEGVIEPEDIRLFGYAETAEQIWRYINEWYGQNRREPSRARAAQT